MTLENLARLRREAKARSIKRFGPTVLIARECGECGRSSKGDERHAYRCPYCEARKRQ